MGILGPLKQKVRGPSPPPTGSNAYEKEVKDETLRMAGGRLFHAREAAMLPFSSAQLVEQKVNTMKIRGFKSLCFSCNFLKPCIYSVMSSISVLYSNQKNTD